jgi:hypothetical protein
LNANFPSFAVSAAVGLAVSSPTRERRESAEIWTHENPQLMDHFRIMSINFLKNILAFFSLSFPEKKTLGFPNIVSIYWKAGLFSQATNRTMSTGDQSLGLL